MRSRGCIAGLAGLVLLVFAGPLQGQEAAAESPLESVMQAYLVQTDEAGDETLTQTDSIRPDDVIEYVLTYTNTSDQPLKDLRVDSPVPEATAYRPESATASMRFVPHFSIDGGRTFSPEPVKYQIRTAAGKIEERVATPDMYTAIRWPVAELAGGETIRLRYRVQVK